VSTGHKFTAEILPGRGGGAYAEIPFDVEQAFGDKRPQVKASIDGESFVTRLVRMGAPCHIVGVPKDIRVKTGKDVGDRVTITVVPDSTPRVITVPADLKRAFKSEKAAQSFFDGLSFTHRKEYVRWIEDAKKDETRAARVAKTIEMLKAGKRGR
jgi:bifunctional DNA-binding transcriptional regulator/antitoxin component of YhaV-PrlF toxin-antitoxin module